MERDLIIDAGGNISEAPPARVVPYNETARDQADPAKARVFPLETSGEERPIRIEDSLCGVERLEVLMKYAYLCANYSGEFWELGVYKGGSAKILAIFAEQRRKKLRLFDSFEGLPAPVNFDNPEGGVTAHGETIMFKGEWAQADHEIVRQKMPLGCDYEIHAGFVPETLEGLEDSKIAMAHVDLDLYEGTKAALEFLYPRMTPGGIIIVDDYGYARNPGVQIAVRETRPTNFRIWSECEYQAILKRNVQYAIEEPVGAPTLER